MYLKTKKMTDISQTQAGFKAESRRNPLWIPRRFNAKSRCVCRNRLNFRLFRYTLVLSETSKSSSVSQQTQPDFVLAKDPLFSLLSDAPQELAQIEIGKGNRESGAGQGGQKSEWHICSKPAPRCKGRTASRWRACNPPNPHPPPQTPQTVCRGAVYPSRRKKTGTVRRKPAIPPTRRPPSRQAPPQTGACETNNCAKTGKYNKKGEFCCKVALCVRRGS